MKRCIEQTQINSFSDKKYLGDFESTTQPVHWEALRGIHVDAEYPFNCIYMVRNEITSGVNQQCME